MFKVLRQLGKIGEVISDYVLFPFAGVVRKTLRAGLATRTGKGVALGVAGGTAVAGGVGLAATIAGTVALGALGYVGYQVASWLLGKASKSLKQWQAVKKKAGILGAALPG